MFKSSRLWVILTGFALLMSMTSAHAQEEEKPSEAFDQVLLNDKVLIDDTLHSKHVEIPESATEIAAEKKRKATVGLAAVAGIAILGVGVIAATMMWARRLRRLARDSGPSQKTEGNDFWFLKPPKPVADHPDLADSHRPPLGEDREQKS